MHKYFINSAIICFQNAVYGLTGLLSVLIPGMPAGVRTQIQREKLLAREVLFDADLDNDKNKRKANNNFGKDIINKLVACVTLRIFKGIQKAYKRQKLCNFHIKDLPFAFRGICLLREPHLYLLKVIFFKIYRILPFGGKSVSALEDIFL